MLKRLTPRERFEQLVSSYEPLLRAAFMDAVNDIKSKVQIKRIVERMEKGDIAGAIQAMHIDDAAFRTLDNAIASAYNGGGVATTGRMPPIRQPGGGQVIIRFDARNIRAETWLRDHSSKLVSGIVEDQRAAVRTALQLGMERGNNPRTTALNIVGRINRATGRREGGILGLTSAQSDYVDRARQELLSGDPEDLRRYLTRNRRDKRFDRTVLKAIREEQAVPADSVSKIVGRYSDNLLHLRGETIARTETMAALNESQMEAMRQAVDGGVDQSTIVKVWRSSSDNRVRDTHKAMHGQSVGMEDKFTSPSGAFLAYPGDPEAPASEIINCRCWMEMEIDFLAGIE